MWVDSGKFLLPATPSSSLVFSWSLVKHFPDAVPPPLDWRLRLAWPAAPHSICCWVSDVSVSLSANYSIYLFIFSLYNVANFLGLDVAQINSTLEVNDGPHLALLVLTEHNKTRLPTGSKLNSNNYTVHTWVTYRIVCVAQFCWIIVVHIYTVYMYIFLSVSF